MKVSVERDALNRLLDAVVSMIPSRSSLPILSNVLVEAREGGTIRCTGTDLDVSVEVTGEAEVERAGAVAVPGKLLAEVARSAASGRVELALQDHQVHVSSPGRTFRLMAMDAGEFPRIPEVDEKNGFEIDPHVLPELISRTSYAVSRDETRPALNGVLWELSPKELRMVATDGHRLAFYRIAGQFPVKQETQVIVPPKSLNQVSRMVKDSGGALPIRVDLGESQIRWRMGENAIFSKLIEGPFPKYQQVIPKENDKRLRVRREQFHADLRAVAAVSDQLTGMVRLKLRSGEVRLHTRAADVGDGEVACADTAYEGDALEVGYNVKYLMDVMQHMTTEHVDVFLKSQAGAGLFKEVQGGEGDGALRGEYTCLVMPLRLAD